MFQTRFNSIPTASLGPSSTKLDFHHLKIYEFLGASREIESKFKYNLTTTKPTTTTSTPPTKTYIKRKRPEEPEGATWTLEMVSHFHSYATTIDVGPVRVYVYLAAYQLANRMTTMHRRLHPVNVNQAATHTVRYTQMTTTPL